MTANVGRMTPGTIYSRAVQVLGDQLGHHLDLWVARVRSGRTCADA
jgi:hypothetical protein